MDKLLIYISWDEADWINLFTLCRGGSIIAHNIVPEEIDLIFQPLLQCNRGFLLDIVAEESASAVWDFEKDFGKRRLRLERRPEPNDAEKEELLDTLRSLFGKEYSLNGSGDSAGITEVSLQFAGKCFPEQQTAGTECRTAGSREEAAAGAAPEADGEAAPPPRREEEMTSLAAIIIEKYRRMGDDV